MNPNARRVAVLGGVRIPFARQNGPCVRASNQDMLTATLDALVGKFGLEDQVLGEVAAGAVLKHSREFNLTSEAVLGSRLAPETPAYDVQQACGTGLEAAILVANKIALGQVDSAIAAGVDTTSDAPLAINEQLREVLLEVNRARSNSARLRALAKIRPQHVVPEIPRNAEPRTGLSMGEHAAIMAREWGITREEQDELAAESHRKLAAAYDGGFLDDLVLPFLGLERDQNLRPDSSVERLSKLRPVFGGPEGTMTAGNSTRLSDGASAVLLASEEWAAERGLSVQAYLVEAQTAAVDHVHKREGLLMAPTRAVPTMLARAGGRSRTSTTTRFTRRSPPRCCARSRRGRTRSTAGSVSGLSSPSARSTATSSTRAGGSLAAGHPFGATGGRIVAGLAKMLSQNGGGSGLISICAAGGLGVTAIMEAA